MNVAALVRMAKVAFPFCVFFFYQLIIMYKMGVRVRVLVGVLRVRVGVPACA